MAEALNLKSLDKKFTETTKEIVDSIKVLSDELEDLKNAIGEMKVQAAEIGVDIRAHVEMYNEHIKNLHI